MLPTGHRPGASQPSVVEPCKTAGGRYVCGYSVIKPRRILSAPAVEAEVDENARVGGAVDDADRPMIARPGVVARGKGKPNTPSRVPSLGAGFSADIGLCFGPGFFDGLSLCSNAYSSANSKTLSTRSW
jgi:hypothetical protein